ncbi:hypothetical protein HN51_040190, partial [Arachis hypogaea]
MATLEELGSPPSPAPALAAPLASPPPRLLVAVTSILTVSVSVSPFLCIVISVTCQRRCFALSLVAIKVATVVRHELAHQWFDNL